MASQLQYRKTVRQSSLHARAGAMHAADMVHLRHLNRSIPFYMLLSDTPSRRGEDDGDAASGIDLRSAGQAEAEVMELGMLQAAWEREELLRVRPVDRAPVMRLSRTIDSVQTATRITKPCGSGRRRRRSLAFVLCVHRNSGEGSGPRRRTRVTMNTRQLNRASLLMSTLTSIVLHDCLAAVVSVMWW
ncbi:unnamed protein product [Ectocarpus sp. CCAP 1310/34]|nr:unnamed protein product [Ectocarpus sp. CCAP 1310/34]